MCLGPKTPLFYLRGNVRLGPLLSAYLKIIFVGLKLKFPNKIQSSKQNPKQQKMQSDDPIIIIINVMMNTITIMVTIKITVIIMVMMKITIIIMKIRVITITIMIIKVACTSPSPMRSLGSHTSSRSTNHSWLR